MPIAAYSVLKGKPTAGQVVSGASQHYQITVTVPGTSFTAAVNIESVDGSEVLYAIQTSFSPPNVPALNDVPPGMTSLPSTPGGLALDFVREQIHGRPMITRAQMTLLPKEPTAGTSTHAEFLRQQTAARALQNAVVALLTSAIAAGNATVYLFGSAFAEAGVVDGIHDIHMNQGNPASNHGADNGVWQDGALFLATPSTSGPISWTAVFLAFQTESWTTDSAGDPTTRVHLHHALEG